MEEKRNKIVFMEADSLGSDIDLSTFSSLGDVVIYGKSELGENASRIQDADVIVANKIAMNEGLLKDCRNLKLIYLTATGTNNLDIPYLNARGIKAANVKGYSTESVAQHTFALLFYLYEKLHFYDHYVKSGEYIKSDIFSVFDMRFHELYGKKWGIIGLGAIGKRVAEIASLFGCEVVYFSTTGVHEDKTYRRVSREELFRECDIISIHAPLNDKTLNLGRGPIGNQEALYEALQENRIGGAGLDVLTAEPMAEDNPLIQIQDSTRLIITPHIAWATVEARSRCVEEVRKNIIAFFEGKERNLCN